MYQTLPDLFVGQKGSSCRFQLHKNKKEKRTEENLTAAARATIFCQAKTPKSGMDTDVFAPEATFLRIAQI
ncbi:hypothetical protein PQR62_17705 [Herbaspirillum lusitanum]|uniref:Uncharacterized protein n=1 Tax=Herbaspirillum lusitanum TaxID=213312 RepID=A0ABW9ACG1_9BURK